MSMATGSALVIIVGTITAMHSEQAFAQHGVDVDIGVKMPRAHAHTPVPEEHHAPPEDEFLAPPHTR
jgi:hypothetical protein